MDWTSSAWIILTGALVAASSGLLGCFLVLRRLSLLGDAISHAVLPGIVIAFLLTKSTTSLPIFAGAIILGLITTFAVQALSERGVQGDAAMGVTFTSLFALGVVLISVFAAQKDLDLDCVLYGEIAYTPWDRLMIGGKPFTSVPEAVWINGGLLILNILILGLFYKEFKICAFDPEMATAVGINVTAMHYLLMSMVSVTTVGAFDSVGAILVVAMLIVPGATAYLLTDRLERMLLIAMAVGLLSSLLGYFMARSLDCSIAGAIATVCGLLFALAFLCSPAHGLVTRAVGRRQMRRRVADEDVLLWAGRRLEAEPAPEFTARELSQGQEWLLSEATAVTSRLARGGFLTARDDRYGLTDTGRARALDLLRRHRLYESYLDDLGYPGDHLHAAADRVEHHLSPALTTAMDAATRYPERDPQGKPIPPAE
jgi:manganese/zinc/iron transport system permease protein